MGFGWLRAHESRSSLNEAKMTASWSWLHPRTPWANCRHTNLRRQTIPVGPNQKIAAIQESFFQDFHVLHTSAQHFLDIVPGSLPTWITCFYVQISSESCFLDLGLQAYVAICIHVLPCELWRSWRSVKHVVPPAMNSSSPRNAAKAHVIGIWTPVEEDMCQQQRQAWILRLQKS